MIDDAIQNKRLHYICPVRLNRQNLYLLWNTQNEDEKDYFDGLHLDAEGRMPAFLSSDEAALYAATKELELLPQQIRLLNLDLVASWLKVPVIRHIKCNVFLSAWNLFGDLESAIVQRNTDGVNKRYPRVYDMLFWGCNLPSMTPEGRHWSPPWKRKHKVELRAALGPGLTLFRSRLKIQA